VSTAPTETRAQRFDSLVAVVLEPLQRYARRRAEPHLADDVVSDALLVLWRRLDDVPLDAQIPWALSVARGCFANRRRAQDRQENLVRRLHSERALNDVRVPVDADPELEAALRRIDDADREVLRLWAWESLEAREIAVVLGITPNAASIRLHRAKQRLRRALGRGKSAVADGHEHVGHEER
jgi:RNA polymerase sigma-70 factor, ECF subfamily